MAFFFHKTLLNTELAHSAHSKRCDFWWCSTKLFFISLTIAFNDIMEWAAKSLCSDFVLHSAMKTLPVNQYDYYSRIIDHIR